MKRQNDEGQILKKWDLNERLIKAMMYVKEKGRITNNEYQKLIGVSKATATRELKNLVKLRLLKQQGTTGKGTFYILLKGPERAQRDDKGLKKGSKHQKNTKGAK